MGGAIGGLVGAVFGHLAVVAAFRISPDAGLWLKGAHGPPFFSLLTNTTLYFAALGAGLYPSGARLRGALTGGISAGAGLLLPLGLATRLFSWGEGPGAEPTMAWFYLVLGTYFAVSALSLGLLGARCRPGNGKFGAAAAMAGSLLAVFLVKGLSQLFPDLMAVTPIGFLPPPGSLVGGLFFGLGTGAAISFTPQMKRRIGGII